MQMLLLQYTATLTDVWIKITTAIHTESYHGNTVIEATEEDNTTV